MNPRVFLDSNENLFRLFSFSTKPHFIIITIRFSNISNVSYTKYVFRFKSEHFYELMQLSICTKVSKTFRECLLQISFSEKRSASTVRWIFSPGKSLGRETNRNVWQVILTQTIYDLSTWILFLFSLSTYPLGIF